MSRSQITTVITLLKFVNCTLVDGLWIPGGIFWGWTMYSSFCSVRGGEELIFVVF